MDKRLSAVSNRRIQFPVALRKRTALLDIERVLSANWFVTLLFLPGPRARFLFKASFQIISDTLRKFVTSENSSYASSVLPYCLFYSCLNNYVVLFYLAQKIIFKMAAALSSLLIYFLFPLPLNLCYLREGATWPIKSRVVPQGLWCRYAKLMRERDCARSLLFVHSIGGAVTEGMAMEDAAYRERRNSRSLTSSPSPSAVFFDLDNTLVETRRADNQTCRKLAEELTREYDIPEDASAKITATYLKQFRKCPDNATLTLDAWRTILWSKALGHKYSHLAKRVYERWLYLRYHYMMLAPNTVSMLHQFRKKYLLGLITNGPSNAQWEKIHKLSLEQYFDVILVSGDLPWEKPEAEIFQKACHFLNIRPEECIMVGDKLETDILGGIEAGLYGTVWIPTTDKPRLSGDDPKPDFTIRHVTELLRILERGPNAPELEDCSSNGSDGS